MGAGKTTIGLGVIELLDACPAIVICPPHLVPKWIREAEEVIPGVTARELRRIGKSKDGDVNDVRTFLDGYDSGKLGHKAIAVVASTAAKMGAGWRPVARAKTIKINGKPLVVYTCPQCGQMQTDKQGVPVTEIEYSETRRWSIAEYIKDKAHGRFKILIGDECHEYKSKSSDRGVAFHQLAEATQYTLWLQWALARPNSAFRDELVKLNHAAIPANQLAALAKELLEGTESTELVEKVAQILLDAARTAQSAAGKREKEVIVQSPLMPLPAVLPEQLIEGNLLPKERWLASFCQSEKARRRRVLVYVRQTGTRDIQDRVESVLRQAGLRAITLYGSVSPRKREAWIERHADADVLITNPRLV